MGAPDLIALLGRGLVRLLYVTAPVLTAVFVVGLATAVLQTLTSVQDQALSFVPKLVVVLVVVTFLGGWMLRSLGSFTRELFDLIPRMRH